MGYPFLLPAAAGPADPAGPGAPAGPAPSFSLRPFFRPPGGPPLGDMGAALHAARIHGFAVP